MVVPGCAVHAGGIQAVGRRLSGATTRGPIGEHKSSQPDTRFRSVRKGVPEADSGVPAGMHLCVNVFRWCRCAQTAVEFRRSAGPPGKLDFKKVPRVLEIGCGTVLMGSALRFNPFSRCVHAVSTGALGSPDEAHSSTPVAPAGRGLRRAAKGIRGSEGCCALRRARCGVRDLSA